MPGANGERRAGARDPQRRRPLSAPAFADPTNLAPPHRRAYYIGSTARGRIWYGPTATGAGKLLERSGWADTGASLASALAGTSPPVFAHLRTSEPSPAPEPRPASCTGPTGPILRANPYPEVTDLICRLPLPTLVYRPEASYLGDRLRIWVRPGPKMGCITRGPHAA